MIRLVATLKIAGRALKRNKLRTLLTMLGMIIGVGAVIAMVGIGNGAKSQIEAQIASMGQNVVLVFSGSFSRGGIRSGWGGAGTLTMTSARAGELEAAAKPASAATSVRAMGLRIGVLLKARKRAIQ